MLQESYLPALPAGFQWSTIADTWVVEHIGFGVVSVDFEERCSAPGWTTNPRHSHTKVTASITGRGWRTILVREAVEYLLNLNPPKDTP